MKPSYFQYLGSYLRELVKRWFWMLSLVPFVFDLINAYVSPRLELPQWTPWVTRPLAVIGFLWVNYDIYQRLKRQLEPEREPANINITPFEGQEYVFLENDWYLNPERVIPPKILCKLSFYLSNEGSEAGSLVGVQLESKEPKLNGFGFTSGVLPLWDVDPIRREDQLLTLPDNVPPNYSLHVYGLANFEYDAGVADPGHFAEWLRSATAFVLIVKYTTVDRSNRRTEHKETSIQGSFRPLKHLLMDHWARLHEPRESERLAQYLLKTCKGQSSESL